jgi:predicted small secreted protein
MFKRLFFLVVLLSVVSLPTLFLTACNTVEGAGKDISQLGGTIAHEAQEHK